MSVDDSGDGVKESLDLNKVVNESTYDIIMDVNKAKKKARKLKVELEEGKQYAGVTPLGDQPEETSSFDAIGNPVASIALPKSKAEGMITREQGLAMGMAPAPRENKFKAMEMQLNQLTGKMEWMEKAKEEVRDNRQKNFEQETEIQAIQAKVKMVSMQARGAMMQAKVGLGAISGLGSFMNSTAMGFLNKIFPVTMAISVATMVWHLVVGMFGDGGYFDVRKLVQDETKLYFEKEFVVDVSQGKIFIGNQFVEGQGIGTTGSSTRNVSYFHLTDRPLYQGY